jgi:hypothetical protein
MKQSAYLTQNELTKALMEKLKELKSKGYELEFRRVATCIYCLEWQQWIMPAHFIVDDAHYFEGVLDPNADRLLYAISLSRGGRGFLIDSCTVYRDNIGLKMVHRLDAIARHHGASAKNQAIKKAVEITDHVLNHQ